MQEVVTAADTDESTRARVARFVTSSGFQGWVIGLILLNAVTLGLGTWGSFTQRWGGALEAIDSILLVIFTAELALRIYAFRGRFFRDPWGIFDLLVIGVSWVPASGPLSVLRVLRVLRLMRLISVVPSLRLVVEAMLAALPGMASITLLMLVLFYVCAVMATGLYGDVLPARFETLGDSMMSLFQLMTMEGWIQDIVFPVMEHRPYAWLFFIPFILVATFVVLNLFIGVIVDSISTLKEQREAVNTIEARAEAHAESALILQELRALRAEVAALRRTVPPG